MASPTAPTIDANGISAPSFASILTYLQGKYRSIFGADTYLDNDSQDGQFLGVIADALNDVNNAIIADYNSFSPATAQGNGLSSNVKINGIARAVATNSTVNVTLVGQAGTTITNGVVGDINNVNWSLPTTVTIPPSGSIIVTATCQQLGNIAAAVNTVQKIQTPTYGWQTVTNASVASPGAPVEKDATLRVRQGDSVALPSQTVLAGIVGAVKAVAGVTEVVAYENDTDVVDANGLPKHSIALVVTGGAAIDIATALALKKTPGGYTYGTTSQSVTDSVGITNTYRYFVPTPAPITVAVAVKALAGYTTAAGAQIQQAVSDYINSVPSGGGPAKAVEWDSSITAGKSVSSGATFKITALTLTGPSGAGTPDVPLAFNQKATCTPASVVLTVT